MPKSIKQRACRALSLLLSPILLVAAPEAVHAKPPTPSPVTTNQLRQTTALQPNFLVILVDDLGYADVGFNGAPHATPNIDRIAKRGMKLERFYTTALCSPTRAGLLTGRYPHRFGIMGDVVRPWSDFGLDTHEKTLAQVLANVGYARRSFLGKWHLGHRQAQHHPLSFGFTSFYGHYNGAIDFYTKERRGERDWHRDHTPIKEEGYATDLLSNEAVRILGTPTQDGKPWLMWLAYNGVHAPFQATEEGLKAAGFDPSRPLLKASLDKGESDDYGRQGRGNDVRQTSVAMIHDLDRGIGHVLDALEANGQIDNTVILFLSDNGGPISHNAKTPADVQANNGPWRGAKMQHFEGGVRVAAAIAWPKGFEPRPSADVGAIAYVDVLPTFAKLANAPLPRAVDGIDVSTALKTGEAIPTRTLFLGEDYRPETNPEFVSPRTQQQILARSRAVTQGPWKLVGGQLYNLDSDPGETTDVAAQNPDIWARLNKEAEAFLALRTIPMKRLNAAHLPAPKNWENPKK